LIGQCERYGKENDFAGKPVKIEVTPKIRNLFDPLGLNPVDSNRCTFFKKAKIHGSMFKSKLSKKVATIDFFVRIKTRRGEVFIGAILLFLKRSPDGKT